MEPTEVDLRLLGVVPNRVTAAVIAWHAHVWDAVTRLCSCGLLFEASFQGHQDHLSHRLAAALNAGAEDTYTGPVEVVKEEPVVPAGWCTCDSGAPDRDWLGDDGHFHQRKCPRVVEQSCKVCAGDLEINSRKVNDVEVFCPNSECTEFVRTFWISR